MFTLNRFIIFIFIFIFNFILTNSNNDFVINLDSKENSYIKLSRFWTNSGFSPSAPLPFNRSQIIQELQVNDVYRNMDYVAALPNFAIKYIRIHWLLSLMQFKYIIAKQMINNYYNFSNIN